jgi:hypothetical protein
MRNSFELVEQGAKWPSGRFNEIACIDIKESELAEALDSPLSSGIEEGLGDWVAAGLRLQSGAMVELIKYKSISDVGFIVRVDYDSNGDGVLEAVLKIIGKYSIDVTWSKFREEHEDRDENR